MEVAKFYKVVDEIESSVNKIHVGTFNKGRDSFYKSQRI
jgi:hypothetical protein